MSFKHAIITLITTLIMPQSFAKEQVQQTVQYKIEPLQIVIAQIIPDAQPEYLSISNTPQKGIIKFLNPKKVIMELTINNRLIDEEILGDTTQIKTQIFKTLNETVQAHAVIFTNSSNLWTLITSKNNEILTQTFPVSENGTKYENIRQGLLRALGYNFSVVAKDGRTLTAIGDDVVCEQGLQAFLTPSFTQSSESLNDTPQALLECSNSENGLSNFSIIFPFKIESLKLPAHIWMPAK